LRRIIHRDSELGYNQRALLRRVSHGRDTHG